MGQTGNWDKSVLEGADQATVFATLGGRTRTRAEPVGGAVAQLSPKKLSHSSKSVALAVKKVKQLPREKAVAFPSTGSGGAYSSDKSGNGP